LNEEFGMSDDSKGLGQVVDGIYARPSGSVFDLYLNGNIEGPDEYVEWNHLIRSATDRDVIHLHINCYGGDVMTAVQLMRAMAESQAHIVASVEGACMSAATFLFLIADSFEISEHSMFMFHNYSGFTFGKGNEMREQINHEDKWSKHLLESIYKDFFTPEEIDKISNGHDYWMAPDEVQKRLESRQKLYEKEAAKPKRVARKKS
jgi:ATP-dependent protease ClpP protease subunit